MAALPDSLRGGRCGRSLSAANHVPHGGRAFGRRRFADATDPSRIAEWANSSALLTSGSSAAQTASTLTENHTVVYIRFIFEEIAGAVRFDQADIVQRTMRQLAGTRPMAWLFARVLHHVDGPVMRRSAGRHSASQTARRKGPGLSSR